MKRVTLLALISLTVFTFAYPQSFRLNQRIKKLPVVGFAQGPVISPDGRAIAYSKENYDGVFVLDLGTNNPVEVCSHLGSGWGMRWIDNQRLLVRSVQDAPDHRQRAMGLELIDVMNKKETAVIPFARQNRIEIPQRTPNGKTVLRNRQTLSVLDATPSSPRVRALQKVERDWTFEGDKIFSTTRTYTTPGNRTILSLSWSPDGLSALVEVTGRPSLYLFTRSSGAFRLLAEKGEHPSWATNDIYTYMQTDDDGHAIVKGDIFVASMRSGRRQNLTDTFGKIALNPSISSDGTLVFNSIEGELYSMKVVPR